MRFFVTGCAGFIGSNLTERLLHMGHTVVGFDNFSTGIKEFLQTAQTFSNFKFIEGDLLNKESLSTAMQTCDTVFHLAGNADVRHGLLHPHKDLEQNALATFNVLEAMRTNKIFEICFASTGSIYGETDIIPTPEHAPFPIQTSLYGASKLAAEGLIQAYCEGFNFKSYIYRFVSILGERYTHGHVFDFYKQLLSHPDQLTILGNGKQKKSYLHVQDCIDGMLWAREKFSNKVNIINLGTAEYCQVDDSINWICEHLKLSPQRNYANTTRGWVGDNPFIFLDCSRLSSTGWKPKKNIQESIVATIQYLSQHQWVLDKRT